MWTTLNKLFYGVHLPAWTWPNIERKLQWVCNFELQNVKWLWNQKGNWIWNPAYPGRAFTKSCSCWLAIETRCAPSVSHNALASSYFFLASHLKYWCPLGPTEYLPVLEQSETHKQQSQLVQILVKLGKVDTGTHSKNKKNNFSGTINTQACTTLS